MKTSNEIKEIKDESGLGAGVGVSEQKKKKATSAQGLSTGEAEEAGDFSGTGEIKEEEKRASEDKRKK